MGGLLFYISQNRNNQETTGKSDQTVQTNQSDHSSEVGTDSPNMASPEASSANHGPGVGSEVSRSTQGLIATKSVSALSADDHKKWEVLQEILTSQNDNDPRLDKTFMGMSDELHLTLQEQYQEIPAENRNQRGLLAFLIARDLKNTEDLDFLKKVYEESPCLSLENCGSRTSSDPHLSGVDEASMNYPQLASLYQLEKQLNDHPALFADSSMKDHAKAVIEQALRFPVPSVQKKAAEIQARF